MMLRPPAAVRGMTKLDKEAFRVAIDFPAIEIDAPDTGIVSRRVRLEPFLIGNKFKPLKSFMESEDPGKKYMIFHPDKVKEDETRKQIEGMLERELAEKAPFEWKTLPREMTFENWDTKSIFRAVLPEGLDFSGYTQIGHIIHCNFADETLPYRFLIAEVLLEKISNCRTVVQKGNIITNVYRNLDLELLAGTEDYVTKIKEGGLQFAMDFSKVYWNSRLSFEHDRVAALFNSESLVYDACCGIGPFVLPALQKQKPRRVVANDLNPQSVMWLTVNVGLNKLEKDRIEIHNMDAKTFIREKIAEDVIRLMKEQSTSSEKNSEDGEATERKKPPTEIHVVMNLPAYAVNFLPVFRGVLRPYKDEIEALNQKWKWNVYCYLFAKSHVDVPDEWYEQEARRMCDEKTRWTESLVVKLKNVRTVSSRKEMFCAQLELPYEYLLAEHLIEGPDTDSEPEDSDEPSSKRKKTEE